MKTQSPRYLGYSPRYWDQPPRRAGWGRVLDWMRKVPIEQQAHPLHG